MIEEEQPIDPTPPEDGAVREAEEEAANEAGEIGGKSGQEGVDPAQRPVAEGGGGVSEGFEQAEERLVEEATTDHAEGDPLRDAGEAEANPDPATYGEADHEHSSENDGD